MGQSITAHPGSFIEQSPCRDMVDPALQWSMPCCIEKYKTSHCIPCLAFLVQPPPSHQIVFNMKLCCLDHCSPVSPSHPFCCCPCTLPCNSDPNISFHIATWMLQVPSPWLQTCRERLPLVCDQTCWTLVGGGADYQGWCSWFHG